MPGTPRLPLCGRGVACAQPRSLGCARRAPQGAPRGALLMRLSAWPAALSQEEGWQRLRV